MKKYRLGLMVVWLALLQPSFLMGQTQKLSPNFEENAIVNQSQDGGVKIVIGLLATENKQALEDRWRPFAEYLQDNYHYQAEFYFTPHYSGIIDGIKQNKVDLVLMGNQLAVKALAENAPIEIFATEIAENGTNEYRSLLIARKDSKLFSSLDDVVKCNHIGNFGIAEPESTSGYLLPMAYIFNQHHLILSNCFANIIRANHEENFLAVAKGKLDLAPISSSLFYERFAKQYPNEFSQIKVIWKSPSVINNPLVMRSTLPESIKDRLYRLFVGFGQSGNEDRIRKERGILAKTQFKGFVAANITQLYDFQIMNLLNEKEQIDNVAALKPSEKIEALAKIDKAIADIKALKLELPVAHWDKAK